MKTLSHLGIGEKSFIRDISNSEQYRYLLEAGFTPGEMIQIVAKSPFRGPVSVRVRNTVIALRFAEAQSILC